MNNKKIIFEIGEGDFEASMGRKPKNHDELDKFVDLIRKGMDAQLDWPILYQCTKDAM